MTDFESMPHKQQSERKKRKLKTTPEEQRVFKAQRNDASEGGAGGSTEEAFPAEPNQELLEFHPWRNLRLILTLQKKDIDVQRKVKLVYDSVSFRAHEQNGEQACEVVSNARLVTFLSDWIQRLLIPSRKDVREDADNSRSRVSGSCLDVRCWYIFKFCLEESVEMRISLSLSRNLLEAVRCIVKDAMGLLDKEPLHSESTLLVGDGFELYSTALDCISRLFTYHGGVSDANLELWIGTVDAVLEAVNKIYNDNLVHDCCGEFFLQLACVMFDPFAKFLRVHPCLRNDYKKFVDKLLEPLMILLHSLHLQMDGGNNTVWSKNLTDLVKEIFSYGCFHPTHLEGFLALHSIEKYGAPYGGKLKDDKAVIKSYHRHLFDRLDKIVALVGIGELLHVFVDQVKCQTRVSVLSEGFNKEQSSSQVEEKTSGCLSKLMPGDGGVGSIKSSQLSPLQNKNRRRVFSFIVKIMEPLLRKIDGYSQCESGPLFSGVLCTVKSFNKLLASCMHENVYLRMEDSPHGVCRHFLKVAFDIIMSFSTKIYSCSPSLDVHEKTEMGVLKVILKELIVAMRYFIEIEYEVVGNDLVRLWLVILSHLAADLCFINAPDECSLFSEILDFGCQLIDLYCELRQVDTMIFALSKAVRILVSHNHASGIDSSKCFFHIPSSCYEAFAKLVGMLLSAQKFRLAISDAVRMIPEGQVGGCIRQLTEEVSESLEWLKMSYVVDSPRESCEMNVGNSSLSSSYLKMELLGRVLTELFTLVLESLTITAGCSSSISVSIEALVDVIRPNMSTLVSKQPNSDTINDLIFSIMGTTSNAALLGFENDILKFKQSTFWILLLLFRLYMSSRVIYKKSMELVPPEVFTKMSSVIGNMSFGYHGNDFKESTDCITEGFFFWITRSSAQLLSIILSVLSNFVQGSSADYSALIFVLHEMVIQRLVDLNRQINTIDFSLQNGKLVMNSINDVDVSLSRKRSEKWERCLLKFQEEAAALVAFITGYVPLDGLSDSTSDDATSKFLHGRHSVRKDSWNFSVCALDSRTLPAAIWELICRMIGVWCFHAAKEKLKDFISLIVQTSIVNLKSSSENIVGPEVSKMNFGELAMYPISRELIRDTALHKQKFFCRYFPPEFCQILKNSTSAVFGNSLSSDVDISLPPDWKEACCNLDSLPASVLGSKQGLYEASVDQLNVSDAKLHGRCSVEKAAPPLINTEVKTCQLLLNLLCWMPEGFQNSGSFSLYATHILNIERLVVESLLDRNLLHSHYDLVWLFVSCRRALNHLTLIFWKEREKNDNFSPTFMLFEGPLPVSWLLKSVYAVFRLHDAFPDNTASRIKDLMNSLMDHTSYVLSTLSENHFERGVYNYPNLDKAFKEKFGFIRCSKLSSPSDTATCLTSSEDIDAWKNMMLTVKRLKDHMRSSLVPLKNFFCNDARVGEITGLDLNQLTFTVSCIQGFLQGLASSLNQIEVNGHKHKRRLYRWDRGPFNELNPYIVIFADSLDLVSCMLLFKDNKWPESVNYVHDLLRSVNGSSMEVQESPLADESGNLHRSQQHDSGIKGVCTASFETSSYGVRKRKSQLRNADCATSILAEFDSFGSEWLNGPFLLSLLKGEHIEAAFLLRHLFLASAAILRIRLLFDSVPMSSRLLPTLVGASQYLLCEFANMVDVPQPITFVWLDGVLKYMEELGRHFSSTNPTSSTNIYAKLIDLHLKAIGKCICVQGRRAALTSHETASSSKTLADHGKAHKSILPNGPHCVDEFKARLRMSFKEFIKKPSELHLLCAVQTLERALVGLQFKTSVVGGGNVSSIVAAGIDCFDLLLEFVSGKKRLDVVKEHMPKLTDSLFNIILHLQSPLIFCKGIVHSGGGTDPDSWSVILMCVELLKRLIGRHSYKLGPFDVRSLCVPGNLFRGLLHQLRQPKAPTFSQSLMYTVDQDSEFATSEVSYTVDRQFCVNLYSACCLLLCTVLKNYRSECERYIGLLQNSVRVLLHCLEREKADSSLASDGLLWELAEGVACASVFRRIYEEIRRQKDVLDSHSSKFLTDYILVYSGCGPRRTGINREIDDALRPGVYALMDACSADDLQNLHTVFEEGPFRNTLATLQHDYKLNFQRQGKV